MRSRKLLTGLVVSFIFVAFVGLAINQRQSIYDWLRLRDYVPSSNVAQLAAKTTMNDYGKRIFYVNHPQIQNKDLFNQNCVDSEQTIVLGCYVPLKGIYLYDVTDDRLNGVEEVTAAHEMLHAAYERLSTKEREKVDLLTMQVYESLSDSRLKKTVDAYREKDISVIPNELHSIIGTEVKDLPADLEEYYAKYFDNRLAIVELSENYEKEFTALEQKADNYKRQLDELKLQIDSLNDSLKTQADVLTNEYQRIQSARSKTDATSFNDQADAYNTSVNDYNARVKQVGNLIDSYNTILVEYNAIVIQENQLIQAIDSRPQTLNSE